jgi:hypothetical protein
MIMGVEYSVEWLAGKTEVLGENLPQCHFVHHKSHMTWARTLTGAVEAGDQSPELRHCPRPYLKS